MGAFLDKPKTEKISSDGEGNGIRYGVSAMQGWRMEMEDAHICETEVPIPFDKKNDKKNSFFGVFDGHAGPKVAQECSTKLLDSIQKSYKDNTKEIGNKIKLVEHSIHEGFINFDENLFGKEPWSNSVDRSGTTAIVCFVMPDHVIWGNCGDSRGIFCSDDKVKFATVDHKPFNKDEKLRIEKAGGTVMMQRVNGSLAVSRALGDFDYKRCKDLPSTEQLVSPEPEITVMDRDTGKDQFLILACDGIFDVMSNEEVIKHVLHQLQLKEELSGICSSLIDKCLHKNSRDNMSVIIVAFPGAPVVSEEVIEKEKLLQEEALKTITDLITIRVAEAIDSLELEESMVMQQLSESMPEYDVFSKQKEISELLTQKRKEKFGNDDDSECFIGGRSDPADAPNDFANMNRGDDDIQLNNPFENPTTSPPQPSTSPSTDADSITAGDKDSATIM